MADDKKYVNKPIRTTQFTVGIVNTIKNSNTTEKKIILENGDEVMPTDFYDYQPGDRVFVFGTSNVKVKLPIWYKNQFSGTPRIAPIKIGEYGLGN